MSFDRQADNEAPIIPELVEDPPDDLVVLERRELDAAKATNARARRMVERATPASTTRARADARRYFWAWSEASAGVTERYPFSADLVLAFVVEHLDVDGLALEVDAQLVNAGVKRKLGRLSVATIEARVRHMSKLHGIACPDMPSPAADPRVKEALSAARRSAARDGITGRPKREAVTLDVLEQLLATTAEDLRGSRDRALLWLAWASGGRRRSEVAAAEISDLARQGAAYTLTIRRSKADQEGAGTVVPIAGRAASALRAWLHDAGLESGPIFRSINRHGSLGRGLTGRSVFDIVRRAVDRAGLDTAVYSPHSIRSGFLTEAGRAGVALGDAMAMSAHRSAAVALRYHRAGSALLNPGAQLGG